VQYQLRRVFLDPGWMVPTDWLPLASPAMAIATRHETISETDAGTYGATAVVPDGGGPGIVLFQEIFGVGDFVLDRAQALAGEGYVVLCPDVFWRIEPNVSLAHDEEGLQTAFGYAQRFGQLEPAVIAGDLIAALAHLRSMPEVSGGVAVMGYCLGGSLAYEAALAGDPDCCVSYYGSTVAARIEAAGDLSCPAIFHFGGADPFIATADAEKVRDTLADRDDITVHIHDGAGHAFENSFAPQFSDPDATAVSWSQTLEFLRRHLGAGARSGH
jgi:carboxymethylenebutenolidase